MEEIEKLLISLIDSNKENSEQFDNLLNELKSLKEKQNGQNNNDVITSIKNLEVKTIEALENNKVNEVPSSISNPGKNTNITIFGGADAQITYKWALVFIGFVLLSYFGFKHIPSYLNESKQIEAKATRNKNFVEFLRLKQFKDHGETKEIDTFLSEVESSDSAFVSQYNILIGYYNEEIDRVKTEKEIKELQNKLEESKK